MPPSHTPTLDVGSPVCPCTQAPGRRKPKSSLGRGHLPGPQVISTKRSANPGPCIQSNAQRVWRRQQQHFSLSKSPHKNRARRSKHPGRAMPTPLADDTPPGSPERQQVGNDSHRPRGVLRVCHLPRTQTLWTGPSGQSPQCSEAVRPVRRSSETQGPAPSSGAQAPARRALGRLTRNASLLRRGLQPPQCLSSTRPRSATSRAAFFPGGTVKCNLGHTCAETNHDLGFFRA